MPLSKSEIKQRSGRDRGEQYVSPHFGDGGWHATPGCETFTTEWLPLGDRILVQLDPDAAPVITTGFLMVKSKTGEIVKLQQGYTESRIGTVLKCGPGRRIEGYGNKRKEMQVKPGDRVVIGKYTDWESQYAGIVVCMEGDVRVILH